jgi:hypothetical protein
MSGLAYSITIISLDSGGAAFQPDLMGSKPGDPLEAGNANLISWNNRTANEHQPWPADAQYQPLPESAIVKGTPGNYLSDPIPAWLSSKPAYVTTAKAEQTTIYYVCKNHPDEQGRIIVAGDA